MPSIHVQNSFEFVELGRDISSNCTGEVQAGTAISGWYQLVPRTHYISTRIYTSNILVIGDNEARPQYLQ